MTTWVVCRIPVLILRLSSQQFWRDFNIWHSNGLCIDTDVHDPSMLWSKDASAYLIMLHLQVYLLVLALGTGVCSTLSVSFAVPHLLFESQFQYWLDKIHFPICKLCIAIDIIMKALQIKCLSQYLMYNKHLCVLVSTNYYDHGKTYMLF